MWRLLLLPRRHDIDDRGILPRTLCDSCRIFDRHDSMEHRPQSDSLRYQRQLRDAWKRELAHPGRHYRPRNGVMCCGLWVLWEISTPPSAFSSREILNSLHPGIRRRLPRYQICHGHWTTFAFLRPSSAVTLCILYPRVCSFIHSGYTVLGDTIGCFVEFGCMHTSLVFVGRVEGSFI